MVALSSAETEYISLAMAGCQALWLRGILKDLGVEQTVAIEVMCDNKSAIALTKNPVFHGRSKHIRIKYHFIRDLVHDKDIEVKLCGTKDQVADILTKALQVGNFNKLKKDLGMENF